MESWKVETSAQTFGQRYATLQNHLFLQICRLDELQFGFEHFEFGHGVACLARYLDRTTINIIDLHFAMEVEIELHRGRIRCHVIRHIDHLVDESLVETGDALMAGCSDNLAHEVTNQLTSGGILQQQVCLRVQGYSHTIEGHVPDGLLPTGLVIGYGTCLDSSIDEVIEDGSKQALILARIVGQIDAAIALMVHATWFRLGRADESETCHELNAREHLLNIGLDANTILYQYHNSLLMEQWR